jgi:uncharacterized protein (DUF924 family)
VTTAASREYETQISRRDHAARSRSRSARRATYVSRGAGVGVRAAPFGNPSRDALSFTAQGSYPPLHGGRRLRRPTQPQPDPERVLDFWFADAAREPSAAQARSSFWYGGAASAKEIDREIAQRFGERVRAAAAGELDSWAATARGRLALVILLDQFPRNLHRGTARAFEHDARALALSREGVANGHLEELSPVEQVFLLMPYQHVEDLAMQREGAALYDRIAADAPREWRPYLEYTRDYARRHLAIVERFGRFPHRNEVLGRAAAAEETAYLAQGGDRFGQ